MMIKAREQGREEGEGMEEEEKEQDEEEGERANRGNIRPPLIYF